MRRCNPFFLFAVSFFIVYELLGPFQYGMQHFFRMPTYGPAVILFLSILSNQRFPNVFKWQVVLLFFSWFLFALAYLFGYSDLATFGSIQMILNQTLRCGVCVLAFLLIVEYSDLRALKIVLVVAAVAIFIQSTMCVVALFRDPSLARNIVTPDKIAGEAFATVVKHEARRDGVAAYAFIHAIPFLFPALIATVKLTREKKNKILLLLGLFFLFYFLVKTDFATPMLLTVALSTLAIFWQRRKGSNVLLMGVFAMSLLVLAVWGESLKLEVMRLGQGIFTEGAIAKKIEDVLNAQGNVNYVTQSEGRAERYTMSWTQFFAHPALGCKNSSLLGGHSYFVDILGYYGLIISMPFFIALLSVGKMISKRLIAIVRPYFKMVFFGYIFLGCVKNAGANEYYDILFLVVPCLLYYLGTRQFQMPLHRWGGYVR